MKELCAINPETGVRLGSMLTLALWCVLFCPGLSSGDLVVLKDNRTMEANSVAMHRGRITVELPSGGVITFSASRVRQVLTGRDSAGRATGGEEKGSNAAARSQPAASAADPGGGLHRPYRHIIKTAAAQYRLSPALIEAIVQVESGFDPRAVSRKGASGLMQIMPLTAKELDLTEPFDPGANIAAGVRYFDMLLKRFDGKTELALAAYNAGPEVVKRYKGVPPYPETQAYVKTVLELASRKDRI